MTYTIRFGSLNIPVDNLEINRVPQFTYYWGASTKDLVGVIHGEKWDANDPNADYFQVTISANNTKELTLKVLDYFKNGTVFSIQTPLAGFNNCIISNSSIDNDQISISLIAKNPINGSSNITSNICLATDVNYKNATPGFIQLFQFGNYVALSTFPFKLTRNIDNGNKIFENDYWSIFELPICESFNIIPYTINTHELYGYFNLPNLMTPVLIQPAGTANMFSYLFGVHPSCELSAYLKVEDCQTGEIWYQNGNSGQIKLAPGFFKLTPIIAIPEQEIQFIEGSSIEVIVPTNNFILGFLTPLTLPISKSLKFYTYENLILSFKGWKTFEIPSNTIIDIPFDYPGTFKCEVYSKDRNIHVTSFTVNVYNDQMTLTDYDYQFVIDNDIASSNSSVSADVDSYIAVNESGAPLGTSNTTSYIVDSSIITNDSSIDINDSDFTLTASNGLTIVDNATKIVKSIDVYFHDIPMVNKPVLVSIDGAISNINFEDATVESLSNSLYKVTFNKAGLKQITIETITSETINKLVTVNLGYDKIITNTEDGNITCNTGDYWTIVSSDTTVRIIPPNSTESWIEYAFGPTSIDMSLISGSKITNVQYKLNIYNPNSLKIVAYNRVLQLLHPPHAEIDYINWFIDGNYIGTGTTLMVPAYISGGHHEIKAIVYSNFKVVELTETLSISNNNANRIQLSCQVINPQRIFDLDSTNRLVTIYNGAPGISYDYLDTSLNIRLSKYLYLERYTYTGIVNDLTW
jgi:hypothetical protein